MKINTSMLLFGGDQMTFAEAKARDDYKFKLNGVEDFIHDLKTGEFMNWTEDDERNDEVDANTGWYYMDFGD